MSDFQYLTIVGVGRSGTSLLMSMLNAHPEVMFPPEFHFINQHLARRPQATLSEAATRLRSDARFARLDMTVDDAIRPFTNQQLPFSMPALYREILFQYGRRGNGRVIGDKAPKYVEYLPVIHLIFPNAKIIHLIRDPRDVYLSRKKAAWSANRPDLLQLLAYRAQYDLGRRLGPQLFGEYYLEVQYEQLLTQPVKTLRLICDKLQIPFIQQMLDFSDSARQLVAKDELSWKQETIGPLLTNNMNKWQKVLTPAQTAQVEAACWPTFVDGLYQSAQHRFSWSQRLTNSYMMLLSRLYQANILRQNKRICRLIQQQESTILT